jgi:flap endonuclease-1
MGIKSLKKVFDKYCPDAYQAIPLSALAGTRIAIDTANLMYLNWSVIWRGKVDELRDPLLDSVDVKQATNVWLKVFLTLIKRLLKYGITPVFVLDGDAPMEKDDTKEGRRKKQGSYEEQLDELEGRIREMDPNKLPSNIRKELGNERKRLMKYRCYLTNYQRDTLLEMLRALGIPIVQAKLEAEQLCAMLCLEGICSAVISSDTDVLAYGASVQIRGFEHRYKGYKDSSEDMDYALADNLNVILEKLEFTREQFLDMCIMCGCDYNTNIFRVGPVTAYKLIKEYGSIDNLPERYSVACLKHQRCRELFSTRPVKELMVNQELVLNVEREALQDAEKVLAKYELDEWVMILQQYYNDIPDPQENCVVDKGYYDKYQNPRRPKDMSSRQTLVNMLEEQYKELCIEPISLPDI